MVLYCFTKLQNIPEYLRTNSANFLKIFLVDMVGVFLKDCSTFVASYAAYFISGHAICHSCSVIMPPTMKHNPSCLSVNPDVSQGIL
jgi:hypothetical protein